MCELRAIRHGLVSPYWGAGLVLAVVLPAAAQFTRLAQAQTSPTTVQLPTLSSFSVETSVSVPDNGEAYRDALRRRRFARTQPHSPLNPKLRPSTARAPGVASSAAVLPDSLVLPGAIHSSYQTASRNQMTATSAETVRARQKAAKKEQDAIKKALADGRAAAAAGRFRAARVYFGYAERHATGSLKEFALAELKMLEAKELAQQSSVTSSRVR